MTNLIFINSHPAQYVAPLYQLLAAEKGINLTVLYLSDETVNGYKDLQFGVEVKWDIPLLQGYHYKFLRNYSWKPSIKNGFFGLINWGLFNELRLLEAKSIVIIHGWSSLSTVIACYIAKAFNHIVCLRGESPWKQECMKPAYVRFLKSIFLRIFLFPFYDKFLYIGNQNKLFYLNFGRKLSQLIFTPYCVDNDRFRKAYLSKIGQRESLRKAYQISDWSIVFLFSGKFISKKRPLDIVKAFNLIKNESSFLVMMGEGELRPDIESYLIENELTNQVLLTGFINQMEVSNYYSMADVFIMCSDVGETWGLSVNEAMNFNLPLIVSDITGCSDDLVKENENGYIFKTGDIEELSSILSRFSAMSLTQRKVMGEHSAAIVAEYSYQKIIKNLNI